MAMAVAHGLYSLRSLCPPEKTNMLANCPPDDKGFSQK
jgi:hypothetical protein